MYTEKFIADVSNPYGYVYVTTNLVTGKRYCGKHKSSKYPSQPNFQPYFQPYLKVEKF